MHHAIELTWLLHASLNARKDGMGAVAECNDTKSNRKSLVVPLWDVAPAPLGVFSDAENDDCEQGSRQADHS